MPPQIKQDLNRSGWETTGECQVLGFFTPSISLTRFWVIDFPSVCENCLPNNPYVQMLKEDHGAVREIWLRTTL